MNRIRNGGGCYLPARVPAEAEAQGEKLAAHVIGGIFAGVSG